LKNTKKFPRPIFLSPQRSITDRFWTDSRRSRT